MRALMVSRWLWEERRRNSGEPGFAGELAQAVKDAGVDLTILSQDRDAGLEPECHEIGCLPVWLYSRERRLRRWAWADKILKAWTGYRKTATDAAVIRAFVRKHGPFDVIWVQSEEPDGTACALASLGGGLPPLLTQVHGLRHVILQKKAIPRGRKLLGWTFSRSARVLANSKLTAQWLVSHYGVPEEKIGTCRIHLTSAFLHTARNQQQLASVNRILFLGAMNPLKAPDIFLEAARTIAGDLQDWKFVMVGGETEKNQAWMRNLRALVDDKVLQGRLEWLGRLEPSQVIQEILRSRFVVCPSYHETFSRTTVEALALGRPVIITSSSGAAVWISETSAGRVVPPGDARALAQAMLELAHDDNCNVKATNASKAVVETLTPEKAAEDLIAEMKIASREKR